MAPAPGSRNGLPGTDPQGADGPGMRCADAAEAAGDPLAGTAPPADHWFLVEHPGPWNRFVLAGPGFDPVAATVLDRWAREWNGRVLFIRRPGRRAQPVERRWFRVDGRPGHEAVRTGLFTAEAELVDVVADPGAGAAHDGRLVLVCTHGRHDTCCALRGRPLAAVMAAELPECTWESSHLGGCRFAAALVLLPHGVVLGNIAPADGAGVAAGYAKGLLPERGVRGRAALSPVVQAAQHHARVVTGAFEVDALRPVEAVDEGAGTWLVRFADPEVKVVLRERRVAADRPLTCAATAPGWMRVFDLIEVAVSVPPRAAATH
jgi:hypothetical protein